MSLTAWDSWGDQWVSLKDGAGPQRTAAEDPPEGWAPPPPVGFAPPVAAAVVEPVAESVPAAPSCTVRPDCGPCPYWPGACYNAAARSEPLLWDGDQG